MSEKLAQIPSVASLSSIKNPNVKQFLTAVKERSDDFTRRLTVIENSLIVEDWHEIGSSGNPGFENGWANYISSSWETAAFYKDPYSVVHIKGLVKLGTLNTIIFTLPEGYRPPLHQMFSVIDGVNGSVRLDVHVDGTVFVINATNNAYQSIWCSFKVENIL